MSDAEYWKKRYQDLKSKHGRFDSGIKLYKQISKKGTVYYSNDNLIAFIERSGRNITIKTKNIDIHSNNS